MRMLLVCALALLAVPLKASSHAASGPGQVRVRLVTAMGDIVVAVDTRHAPKTAANFLAYVDDGRLDNTVFYRAARQKGTPGHGFIQGGIRNDYRRMLAPLPLESTNITGIHHVEGTLSMARGDNPNSANCNFSILTSASPNLDAHNGSPGFAAFGHVVSGMNIVRKILAVPTGGGSGEMKDQMILQPVKLLRAVRLDGVAKPTGGVKPWLIFEQK